MRPSAARVSISCLGVVLVLAAAVASVGASRSFAETAHAASLACNRHIARLAVARSPLGHYMATLDASPGLPGVGPATNPQDWFIQGFFCRNFTGSTDMAVQFDCCTADSPTPLAIFRAVDGKWKLSYSWHGVSYHLAVRGRSFIEERPVYEGGPLCCPAYYAYWSVSWNGRRWIVRRTTA